MELSIKTDFGDVLRKLQGLRSDVASKALASAMNKTMDQARTQVLREVTREFSVSRDYVQRRLRITRATAAVGKLNLSAMLSPDGKRSANLIGFVEKSVTLAEGRRRAKAGTQQQLFFQVKRSGGRKTKAGAFIGNRGRTVFQRVPGTVMASRSKYAGTKHAQQIKPVQVIDVPSMFNTKRINRVVVEKIREVFPQIFDREVRFYLARVGG